jgi:hypothetical protein
MKDQNWTHELLTHQKLDCGPHRPSAQMTFDVSSIDIETLVNNVHLAAKATCIFEVSGRNA